MSAADEAAKRRVASIRVKRIIFCSGAASAAGRDGLGLCFERAILRGVSDEFDGVVVDIFEYEFLLRV